MHQLSQKPYARYPYVKLLYWTKRLAKATALCKRYQGQSPRYFMRAAHELKLCTHYRAHYQRRIELEGEELRYLYANGYLP